MSRTDTHAPSWVRAKRRGEHNALPHHARPWKPHPLHKCKKVTSATETRCEHLNPIKGSRKHKLVTYDLLNRDAEPTVEFSRECGDKDALGDSPVYRGGHRINLTIEYDESIPCSCDARKDFPDDFGSYDWGDDAYWTNSWEAPHSKVERRVQKRGERTKERRALRRAAKEWDPEEGELSWDDEAYHYSNRRPYPFD